MAFASQSEDGATPIELRLALVMLAFLAGAGAACLTWRGSTRMGATGVSRPEGRRGHGASQAGAAPVDLPEGTAYWLGG